MANTLKFGNSEWYGTEGNILAYNDENGNFKPLPFDFSRGSSATVVNKQGLIETVKANNARVEYLNNANGALLLEPTRTNTITYSNDFTLGGWQAVNVTVTSNYGISPDGTQNSTKLVFSGANTYFNRATSSTGTETSSIYIKGIEGETIKFGKGGNVASGAIHTLTGDWQRLIVTTTDAGTAFHMSTFGGVTAREVEIFGAVQEAGSYATSYIPTQGTAQTRLSDTCSNGGNDQVINSTEGVLYLNTATLVNTQTTDNSITLTDGGNNKIIFRYRNVNAFNVKVFVNGIAQAETTPTLTNATEFNKIAIKWKLNDYKIYVNGINVFTDNNALVFPINSINTLDFADGTSTPLFGKVMEVKLYDIALSDSELAALTQV